MIEKMTCIDCGRTLPIDDFAFADKKTGRRKKYCSECNKEKVREWRRKNPEKAKASVKKWQRANREKVKVYQEKYREEHREELSAKKAKYYEENCEEIKKKVARRKQKLSRYKNLTRQQQLELFEANKGLVWHIAKSYKCHECLYEDMIQAGYEWLWKAILELNKYKPNKAKITTWFGWYIKKGLGSFTYKAANTSGLSVGAYAMRNKMKKWNYEKPDNEADHRIFLTATRLDAPLNKEDNDSDPVSSIIGKEDKHYDGLSDEVTKLLSALDDRHRECIIRFFGIGCEPETIIKIAESYGVSDSAIYYWIDTALEQLRDIPGTSSLAVYL